MSTSITTTLPSIRQLVIASPSLKAADDLKYLLNLGESFYDKGVAEFDLENAVFALGNQFLEIIAPLPDRKANIPAGRFLQRNGAGGYMAIFQVANITETRSRVDNLNVRRVWNIDLADISASHLHPADIGGAIVSIDEARPKESWRWAGLNWEQRSKTGGVIGAILSSPTPQKLAAKWGEVLNVPPKEGVITLNKQQLIFQKGAKESLVGFKLIIPDINKVLERAKALNLLINGQIIHFQGVELHLTHQ